LKKLPVPPGVSPKRCGIENEVLDAASIEVSRRLRHVKTDGLDGE
jgi:hypothetical protein